MSALHWPRPIAIVFTDVSASAFLAALAVLTMAGVGCGDHARSVGVAPEAAAVGPAFRIFPDEILPEDPLTFIRAENVVRLAGAINGTVAFQFVLSATAGPAVGVELSAENFQGPVGTIPRDAVRLYRQWPITVSRYPNWYLRSQGLRRPRDFYDVLVPVDAPKSGQPFVIPAGGRLPFWVEIAIPIDSQTGVYNGGVTVRDAAGRARRLPVELVVRDVYLSPHDALPILARVQLAPLVRAHTRIDPRNLKLALADDPARRVLRSAFTLLREHGLHPYTDEVHPLATLNGDGGAELDWTAYDAFCELLIDGSAYEDPRPAHAWPLPVDLSQPDPAQYGGIHSAAYAAVLKDHLTKARDHFAERGWLNRAFVSFDLPKTPNPQEEDLAQVRQLARIVHQVDPRLAFVSSLIPQPMNPFGWFEHRYEDLSADIDVWATPARYQHPPTLQYLQTLGKRTWLLPDRPPFSGSLAIEAPLVHARSLPWQAFQQGHEAVVLLQATDWPDRLMDDPIEDREQRSDAWLLYPGTPFGLTEPVPSLRLKQLQLGIQDYQLLRLLETHGRGETARLLARSLIKAAGTDAYGDNYQDGLFGRRIDDPAMWELARMILLDEVANALLEGAGETSDRAAIQLAWARFLGGTRRIEAWTEAARLTVDDRPGQTGYLLRYDVAVRSELRTSLEGQLTFGPLAPGLRRVSDIVRVGPIPEMGLTRNRLVVASPALPAADLDGHYVQNIVFDGGVSGTVSTDAVLSLVQAAHVPQPIIVDGDLSDWPPSEFNIAGDFRRIGVSDEARADPSAETGRELRARAESQTVAYFCQDGETLYIALHAGRPADRVGAAEPTAARNFVEYEDLLPQNEDLVEILIDPTNAGTQSDGLYHIVLKSTGNPIFERGIGTIPPIGQHQPWPGIPPACCVAPTKYGWCAEIAIPIASFGPHAAKNPVWGLNLARLEPSRGECSDWARAPRYCYDPRTLGNLVWPQ